MRWLRSIYERLLERTLSAWVFLAMISLVGVLIAGVYASQTGRTFLPEFNEGALTLSVVTFPGTSLEQSNQLGHQVEMILLRHPEVIATSLRTGRAELDEHAQGVHASEIDVRLKMRERNEEEFLTALRSDLSVVPGTNIMIGQPISHRIDHMISGTRANVAVKIFGAELDQLRKLAAQVKTQMSEVRGAVDLAIEEQANLPIASIRFNRDALAQHDLQIREVAETIEVAFYGKRVSRIISGSSAFDLVVKYSDEAREDLNKIHQLFIPTPSGAWVPLESLAHIQLDRGPHQISRENGQRKIVVMCNVGEGVDLGTVVRESQRLIKANVELPSGYYVEYGGQFEAAEEATKILLLLGGLVILGIFLLLYIALSSGRDSALIMLNLPLALIGGMVGVWVSGGVISIASLIGFITLFGIATRNGIMMITHIRHLIGEEGVHDARLAVIRGASERLTPILMTALASGLGLLPLALASGEPGSEIQAPMATVILFGLVTSTLLNMLVVPAMMFHFGSVRSLSARAQPAV